MVRIPVKVIRILGFSCLATMMFVPLVFADICSVVQKREFQRDFNYMAFGGETCVKSRCLAERVILPDVVYAEIVSEEKDHPLRLAINSAVDEAFSEISRVTKVVFNGDFLDSEGYIFIIVASPAFAKRVLANKVDGINAQEFDSFILPALKQQKCAGIVSHNSNGDVRHVSLATIFVPESMHDPLQLRMCVFEELLNSAGLLRDPPGSASLFDNGNYSNSEAKFGYSEGTLAMLEIHYALARGKYVSIDDFVQQRCPKLNSPVP
jgi:hypothetical protein